MELGRSGAQQPGTAMIGEGAAGAAVAASFARIGIEGSRVDPPAADGGGRRIVPTAEGQGSARHAAPAPRLPGLTRLRLVFIGWVVLYHLDLALEAARGLPLAGPVLRKGFLGVDGFFLLSGFALWLGYHARPPRGARGYARFLARRMAKILPLHLAALAVLLALVAAAAAAGVAINDPERFGWRDFWLQLLLLNAWETTDRLAWNYPSWALSAEWAGYLAFPVLLAAVLRLRGSGGLAAPALLGALLLAGLFVLGAWYPEAGLNLTVHLGLARFGLEFTLGLLLGRIATALTAAPQGAPRATLPLAAALAAACLPFGIAFDWDALTVAGLAALIAAAFLHDMGRGAAAAAAAPPPRDLALRLGEASYGVYMCWVFVEAALVLLLRATDPGETARLALMAGAFAVNLGAGWLAWRLLEVPANRWILARLGR